MQLGYVLTGEDNFVSAGAASSDRKSVYLTKTQSLELRYGPANGGNLISGAASSQNQSIQFSYRSFLRRLDA